MLDPLVVISEVPDPDQLDLFLPALPEKAVIEKEITAAGEVETASRDPTVQRHDMGEKYNASSLHRKSRELVSLSYQRKQTENDDIQQPQQP